MKSGKGIVGVIVLVSLIVWGITISLSQAQDPIRVQAQKVFAFDKDHPNVLPPGDVRALSIALAFRDENGARQILERFKQVRPRF